MNVVSIYMPRPDHPLHQDFRPFLELQRQSCKRFNCRQIVITDLPGAKLLNDFECFVVEDMPQSLMPALVHGQAAYLGSNAFDADTLMLGADCLLAKDPRPVFLNPFDFAVTTHPFSDCILNTGAIFCRMTRRGSAEPFWRAAAAACGDRWGDDQLSLAKFIDPTLDHGPRLRPIPGEDREALVYFLPVPGYNDAPDEPGHAIDPVVVHFRGRRKAWMAEWSRRHLEGG